MFWFVISPFLFVLCAATVQVVISVLRKNQVFNRFMQRFILFLFCLAMLFPVVWLLIGSTPGAGVFFALFFSWMLLAGTDPFGYGHHPRLR